MSARSYVECMQDRENRRLQRKQIQKKHLANNFYFEMASKNRFANNYFELFFSSLVLFSLVGSNFRKKIHKKSLSRSFGFDHDIDHTFSRSQDATSHIICVEK